MTQTDLAELFDESRFSPFVITMTDGFAIAVDDEMRKHALIGRNLVVLLDKQGDFMHLPYRSIAHITEPKR